MITPAKASSVGDNTNKQMLLVITPTTAEKHLQRQYFVGDNTNKGRKTPAKASSVGDNTNKGNK